MDTAFRHLNVRGAWPGFALEGLVVTDDGALTLAPLPKVVADAPGSGPLDPVTVLGGPAGVAVDEDGTVYVADPAGHRVLRIDGCDGTSAALPCLSGPGRRPGQLNFPGGLCTGPRRALYVADRGNHRVQVIDLGTGQLRGVWGQRDPWADPVAGSAPGLLDEPWDVAADDAGFVYVAEHGNARVQKFDADGQVVTSFGTTLAAQPEVPAEPAAVLVATHAGIDRLLVLDARGPRLLAYDFTGVLDTEATEWWTDLPLRPDSGLAFADGVLYVGDPVSGRVLTFDATGGFRGTAAGFDGPARSLALDGRGRLFVHPGAGELSTMDVRGGYAAAGSLVAGPIAPDGTAHRWHRLSTLADPLAAGAHVRWFSCVADTAPPAGSPLWQAAPADALDVLVAPGPGPKLWLRAELRGDGTTTPVLRQVRVDFDHEGYLRYLPAIFRDPEPGGFLERALALLESFVGDAEADIDALPRLFDPGAAPAAGSPSWLRWLAGWLALPLSPDWDEATARAAIARAFTGYGTRGSAASLRALVRLYTGVEVTIDEPGQRVSVWAPGTVSTLGWDTMLAVADPQGAVLDTTATAGRAQLVSEEDYGFGLFEPSAHRFCVGVPAAHESELDRIREVLDREKPAHTVYETTLVEHRMRVGVQARLGIDSYVACPPDPLEPGRNQPLGTGTVLGTPPHHVDTVGRDARAGRTAIRR